MLLIYFDLIEIVVKVLGYNLEVLLFKDIKVIDEGLKYVNNDVCYLLIIVVG